MQDIFISIIVPVYNVELYLRACLDSIARLSAVSWEAILIDDGSTDGSGAICDDYAAHDTRFKVIHQDNAGVSAARNAGLDVVRGKWIWFVDSDDTINADFEIVNPEVMEQADYVLFDMQKFDDGKAIPHFGHQFAGVRDADLHKNAFLLKNICNHHQRLFYRKTWVMINHHQRLAFSRGVRVGEDLEFQYKYLTRCKHPVRLQAVLYNYRLREGSATQDLKFRKKNVEDLPVVLEHLLVWCEKEKIKSEPWLELRIQHLFQNLLYSASLVSEFDAKELQAKIRRLLDAYEKQGFTFPNVMKMRLAHWSIKVYFVVNKIYLKVKGIK